MTISASSLSVKVRERMGCGGRGVGVGVGTRSPNAIKIWSLLSLLTNVHTDARYMEIKG